MPRKPIGKTAMTDAERQARYRAARIDAHEIGSFFVRLECRFSTPACMISPHRAERRSRLANGGRQRRREAVWTAASTARRFIRSDLPPHHCIFRGVLVAATSAFEKLVTRPAKDLTAGRKSNAQDIALVNGGRLW
jgi:hypothetical protein